MPGRRLLFPLTLRAGENDLYLRVASRDNIPLPLLLWPAEKMRGEEARDSAIHGALYGVLVAFFAGNLLLFAALRDPGYFYYLAYCASFAISRSVVDGTWVAVFSPGSVWWLWRLPLFTGLATSASLLLFTRNFFPLRLAGRALDWANRGLFWLCALFCALAIGEDGMLFVSRQVNILVILVVSVTVITALAMLRRGYRPARMYLLAWAGPVSTITLAAMANLGLAPAWAHSADLVSVGFLWELLFLSFALGARYNEFHADNRRLRSSARVEYDRAQLALSNLRRAEADKSIRFVAPHFLLNALNRIMPGLAAANSPALRVVRDLATQFREVALIAARERVTLGEELALCRKLLELVGERYSREISLVAVDIETTDQVPPLILHTLLENAVSHGAFTGRRAGFRVEGRKTASGAREYEIVTIGDIPPSTYTGAGIGMRFIEARLEAAYPGNWSVEHGQNAEGWRVLIRMPI